MLIYSNYMVHDTVKNWQIWRKIIENEGGWKRFFQIIRRDVIILKKIHILNDVKEAFPLMRKLSDNKTYVLLENDLPDIFNE